MKKDKKAEFTRLPFEVDERIDDSLVTAHAGVPLVIELFRATGAARVLDEPVKIKSRKRGLAASEMAESFFTLWASGGERCEDFQSLREDVALAALLGRELPAPNTARDFMESFHEENLPLLQSGGKAKELRFLDGKKAGYGISAVMSPELRAAVECLAESEWKTINEETDAVRQWSEVAFCPNDGGHRKEGPVARRYLVQCVLNRLTYMDGHGKTPPYEQKSPVCHYG